MKNFCNIVGSRTDLFAESLHIKPNRREKYCKDAKPDFLSALNLSSFPTMETIENIWYDGYEGNNRDDHYHPSRYRFLNLHCFFHGNKTIELRCFNSSLDEETIKAYLDFALGLNYLACTVSYTWYRPVALDNPRYTMVHFLQRIGLKGREYAKTREILTRHLPGNPNWRR